MKTKTTCAWPWCDCSNGRAACPQETSAAIAAQTMPTAEVLAVLKQLTECPLDAKQGADYEMHMRACRAHDAVAALIAERDALRKAAALLLESAPAHMCYRNKKERYAYSRFRSVMGVNAK